MDTVATQLCSPYDETTANMQVDPAARPCGGAAESRLAPERLTRAACASADAPRLDWVPDVEETLVPEPVRGVCGGCPDRRACLLWALGTGSEGYWAGTTTADRERMRSAGPVSIHRAELLQAHLRRQARSEADRDAVGAKHPPGEGGLGWYRRRCRCGECRRANADQRAAERARARTRQGRLAAA